MEDLKSVFGNCFEGLKPLRRSVSTGAETDNFYFRVEQDLLHSDFTVRLVDLKEKEMNPDDVIATDASAEVLRLMRHAMADSDDFNTGWDTGYNDKVSLAAYPEIAVRLLDCKNVVVGKEQKPSETDEGVYELHLEVTQIDEDADYFVMPKYVNTSTGKSDIKATVAARRVSREVLLYDGKLCRLEDLGENFRLLDSFLNRKVPKNQLCEWLSLLGSYLDNVKVYLNGSREPIKWSRREMQRISTLVFSQIDSDKALHIEVAHLLPHIDYNLQNDVALSAVAVAGDDNTEPVMWRARPVDRNALNEDIAKVTNLLKKYSPNRAATKETYIEGGYMVVPPEVAGPFLLGGLPQLLQDFALIGSEKLLEYKIQPAYPKVNVKIASSGIDFLDTTTSVAIGDQQLSLADVLRQYRKNRFVTLSDGSRAILDPKYMKRMERIFRVSGKGKDEKVQVSYFDIPEIEYLLHEPLKGKAPERYRTFIEGYNSMGEKKLKVPGLKANLRGYQEAGVKWMHYLHDNSMGGCLADDMGLGKTVQTIAMLCLIYLDGRREKPGASLIVMPKSLIFNWEQEIKKFTPKLSVYTYYGATRDMEEALKHDVVLTTYGMMRNDIEDFRKTMWYYIVLDESQNIKNLASQTAKASFLLKGAHRLALSGTPMENNVMELYSLFRFLNPAMLGDEASFAANYALPIQNDSDSEAMSALRRKIYPFMLRRLKQEVLEDLPDISEQVLYTEMEPEQARVYEERRRYYKMLIGESIKADGIQKSQFVMFQALTELRRLASVPSAVAGGAIPSPKLDPLVESIAEATANGHKCVVFFNFIAGMEMVGDALEAHGIGYASMSGSTVDRRAVVSRFQKDPDCNVLLCTLKVGGVGLNLTAADMVFIFEPWWNRAAERQAIDRLHRIGQKHKVQAFSMITRGTIEERIRQLQDKKSALFDGLISSDSTLPKKISEEDINFMLS